MDGVLKRVKKLYKKRVVKKKSKEENEIDYFFKIRSDVVEENELLYFNNE